MKRRFTDCDKWQDEWFCNLNKDTKLAWLYICDTCTNAGRWKKNIKTLNFFCDTNFTEKSLFEALKDKLIDKGSYFFIPAFLKFQYPSGLDSKKHCVISVLNELKEFNLYDNLKLLKGYDKFTISLHKFMINLPLGYDKFIMHEEEKETETEEEEETEKEEETETETETEEEKEKEIKKKKIPLEEISQLYNSLLGNILPKCLQLTKQRVNFLKQRWEEDEERQNIDWWKSYFEKVSKTPFLCGENNNGWKCDFEWLIRPTNLVKVIEGRYDSLGKKKTRLELMMGDKGDPNKYDILEQRAEQQAKMAEEEIKQERLEKEKNKLKVEE